MLRKLVGAALVGILGLALVTTAMGRHATFGACHGGAPSGTNGNYVKPSSLAPGERSYNNAYGAPIAKPILARRARPKAKAQPQLRSSPLPSS